MSPTDQPQPDTTRLTALIEEHARVAVLPIEAQSPSYIPTPYEANALKNCRFILRRFAEALGSSADPPPSDMAEICRNCGCQEIGRT